MGVADPVRQSPARRQPVTWNDTGAASIVVLNPGRFGLFRHHSDTIDARGPTSITTRYPWPAFSATGH